MGQVVLRGVVRRRPADHPGAGHRPPAGPAPVLPAAAGLAVLGVFGPPCGEEVVTLEPGRGCAVTSPCPGRVLVAPRPHAVAPHRSAPALASTAATHRPVTTETASMSRSRCRAARIAAGRMPASAH